MTVSTSTAKAGPYAGAGSVGPFTVPFRFLDASHLQVIRTATNGVDSVLVLTTDYTVSGVGLASGSVTLTTALASGEKLTVIRSVPFTQEADYVNNDAFPAESHETALDKLTMQTQQLKERVDAALTLPATAAGVSTTLPAPVAGNVIGWDQGGTGLQNYTMPELVSTAVYADWKYKTFVGNGSTVSYVLDTAPGNIANLDVSFDGVTQVPMADFTLSGNVVTFTSAPPNGVNILFRYGSSVAEQTSAFTVERKTATASQTVFTLGNVYVPGANNLAVYVNGLRLSAGDDYIETNSTTVTFTSGLASGDEVTFVVGREISGATGAENVSFLQAGTGAVARSVQAKLRDVIDIRDFGITPDGVTDRTAAINAVTAALGAAAYRGTLVIPADTKFNPTSVFAAVPTGVMLDITDSVNWGQPPGYRNRFRMLYSGDLVNDDTQQIVASNHHPAIMLLNMGTAPSVAASSRYGTLLHGVGRNVDGDPMLGWLFQYAKAPSANKWRCSWRLQTPYNVAIANPTYWTAGQVVSAGAYRISDGGKVYQTTAGGTCGVTAPTGTGAGINDGGVLWNYVQAALNIDSTRMDLDEDANSGFYGPAAVRMTFNGNGREHYFEVDPVSQDVVWRDNSRSTDLWRSSTANGLRTGRIQSLNRVNTTVSATGAITLLAPLHTLTASGGPWDITDLTLPAGQTSGTVTLWFLTANLTLKNNANIVTRTGADIASAANMMVTLYKDTAISGSWIVLSRN